MSLHPSQARFGTGRLAVRNLTVTPVVATRVLTATVLAACAAAMLLAADATAQTRLLSPAIMATSVAAMAGLWQNRGRMAPRMRIAWGVLAAALGVAGIGTGLSTVEGAVGAVALAMAAVGSLIGLVGIVIVLSVSGHRWRSALLDTAIVAAAGSLLLWVVLVDPVLRHIADRGEPLALAVFPLSMAPILVILTQMALAEERKLPAFWLLLASMTLSIAGTGIDFARQTFGYTWPEASAPLLWVLSMGLLAAAALHPSMVQPVAESPSRARAVSHARVALLAFSMLAAPVVLWVQTLRGSGNVDLGAIALGGALLAILAAARLGRSAGQLQASLDQSEQLQADLWHRSFHDSLTGLPNRAQFSAELDREIARGGHGVAVLFLDLDDFKVVNDTLGHAAGDQLLVETARRLAAATRTSDLLARLGGDEFALLMRRAVDDADVGAVADRLLAALRPSFGIAGHELHAHASIGAAIRRGAGVDGAQLVQHADIAMYLAKHEDKGGYRLFEPDMHQAIVATLDLRRELETAVEQDQFTLYYQPVMELRTGALRGVEALVRWDHPERGVVPPAEFIPLAESTGLILPLGRRVLQEAVEQARRWQEQFGAEFTMSVNISPRQLDDRDLVGTVAEALRASGLAPRTLTLEVTESVLNESKRARETLERLRALGVRIAIDDFGTGYSTLARLREWPVDVVKIDRSFVQAVAGSERERAFTETIVRMADSVQLETVAEGIETEIQYEALDRIGCGMGQGYLMARPMAAPIAELYIGKLRTAGRRQDRLSTKPRRP